MTGYTEPTLFDELEAAVETVTKVAPNLFERAHPAGDLVIQDGFGHFALQSLPDRSRGPDADVRHGSWVFVDLGSVLGVVMCRTHGNTIDPARARALGEHLIAWADRKTAAA